MSKSLYLFAALSFLFLTNSYTHTYSSICSSSDCGNGIPIRYPFWVDNITTATRQFCGYPDFGLICSDNGQPILALPSNTYYVTDINYDAFTLTLVDIDVVNQSCPRARHNATLGTLPLSYNQLDLNLRFYFNCSVSSVILPDPIECFESSGTSNLSYVLTGNKTDDYDSLNCEEKVVVVVKKDEIDSSALGTGFGKAMNKGFVLDWGRAADCAECEDSEGYCGYNQTAKQMLCFCKDGSIAAQRCNKGLISTMFTIVNKCEYTVWPGIFSSTEDASHSTTGFVLQTGESRTISAPTSWGGRIWGRTLCSQDSMGNFSCVTGDCRSGKLECAGNGATPPATMVELSLGSNGSFDSYDVSLVNGYNVPMLVVPQGGSGDNCSSTGCVMDLNGTCPSELKVASLDGKVVACKSPCLAFNSPQYCCIDAHNTKEACKPSSYSEIFKSACPSAYSYAYDDKTSKFLGASANYTITFCPTRNTSDFQAGKARDCLECEDSKGYCGYNQTTKQMMCFCKDGSIAAQHCYKGSTLPVAEHSRNLKRKLIIGFTSGVTATLLICITIFYCTIKSLRQKIEFWKTSKVDQNIEAFIRNQGPLALTRYKFVDVKKMTNSFKVKLGQGGYGVVYEGKLLNGCLVAVKILKSSKGNGEEFINEVASISRTSHVNVVTLLGFCLEGRKKALIYEFMANGSLEKFISSRADKTTPSLTWENLYQIAIGTARGLEYLHRGCNTQILHFDIKPHNILLDESFCPKISDFGLAKLCPKKESIISISEARGTIGYLAPEVWNRNVGAVSRKSDVYSYGMMLLDMVGGRKNMNVEANCAFEIYFPDWIYDKLEQGNNLGHDGVNTMEENDITKRMTIVGLWCIQTLPSQRPTISRVIDMLEGSLD